MKERLHWLAMHGFVRGVATIGVRRGDLQARLIADPTVAADPVPFYEQVRARGPLVKGPVNYLTADHALAHVLLRSDDFRVVNDGLESAGAAALAGAPHARRSAASAARTVVAGRRTARPYPLPQDGIGGVHSQGGRRAA